MTTQLALKGKVGKEQYAASRRIACLYLIAVITVIGRFVCYCMRKAGTRISETYRTELSGTHTSGVPRGGVQPPPPDIPKAHQNRAKLNPIVKTVKNC